MEDKSAIQLLVEEPSDVMLGLMIQMLENYEPGLVEMVRLMVETFTIDDVGEIPDKNYADNLSWNGCLVIPNTVTTIGLGVFMRCSGLTSVYIPRSVTGIGDHAF